METLIVALIVLVIIMISSMKKSVNQKLLALESELFRLRDLLKSVPQEKLQPPAPEPVIIPVVQQIIEPEAPPVVEKERSLSDELELLLKNSEAEPEPAASQAPAYVRIEGEPVSPVIESKAPRQPTVEPPSPSFLERNPDLEKFIGENLVSKIGIGILVLAIGYFVKFAIDNEWIGPVGRVGIGILCGGILVGLAHAMRKSYGAFSSVLVGGGLAIFYFTIALAFHQYHLFSQTVAFIIMVVITAFSVILSHLYNRQELAIIALVGGFATPFMVSTGKGNFMVLFTYLVILNSGLLVIAYSKAWRILNVLAFAFTVILFGSWLFSLEYNAPFKTYRTGFLFATLFYVLFFIINIMHNIRENKKFIASDFGILLSNTCVYFAAGLFLLTKMNAEHFRGLFTAGMGAFNLAATYVLFRNRKIDNNILYLLIGITLSFISLAAPIQLNGHNITLFWATEAVLLYWLFQKSGMPIIRYSSLIVWVAMLVSLFMDWANVYGKVSTGPLPVIFNKGFITTAFAAIASYGLFLLRKNEPGEQQLQLNIYPGREVFRITGLVLLYLAGAFEINFQFRHAYKTLDLHILYLLLYTYAYVLLFIIITGKVRPVQSKWYVKALMMALAILIYLFCIPENFYIQRSLLEGGLSGHFIAHWAGAIIMAVIMYRLVRLLWQHIAVVEKYRTQLTWLGCLIAVIFLSVETHLAVNTLFYKDELSLATIQRVFIKTGLPILWGLCSFCFMWLGMKYKFRTLRIVSLTLFSIILAKLFLFDIRNIPVAGKIAAFFCLGILLLVVSFMYQRLKKIIIEDGKKSSV
jgi:uncharacterized membrane protein